MSINIVAILGVGLIGGSFGLALRKAGFAGRLIGVSSDRTIQAALRRGAIDVGAPIEQAVADADLIYLAQPISRILELLPQVRRFASRHALVTDAGSTKEAIVSLAEDLFDDQGPLFIGGHPMAGKEGRGVEISDAALFSGAAYALTPTCGTLPKVAIVDSFLDYLGKLGAEVHILTAAEHDKIVSWTSHMPQLASTALASVIFEVLQENRELALTGSGLRDMTRLAESPFEIWSDILDTNRNNLYQALSAYIDCLQHMRNSLNSTGLDADFKSANIFREKLRKLDV